MSFNQSAGRKERYLGSAWIGVKELHMNKFSNMKITLDRRLFGNTAVTSLILVAGIFLVVGFACGGSGKPAPSEYVGAWTGDDGSTLTIRGDGSADYKSNGQSVSGGSLDIDDAAKTLSIKFAGLGPSFTIDSPPAGGKMTLSGVVYKKGGNGLDTRPDSKPDNSRSEIPSNDKLQTLVKTTFVDFGNAVQAGDFEDFHKKVAKVWRDQTTPDDMRDSFGVFVDNKANYDFENAVSPLDATLTPPPRIESVSGLDALVVQGYYPTKPQRANFELKYTIEDDTWKLIGIRIDTKNE